MPHLLVLTFFKEKHKFGIEGAPMETQKFFVLYCVSRTSLTLGWC